ncbi:MAG: SIR2 family NAD-dependent protein deacylase [Candidatus Heimdallarchaeota archaeon]
MNLEEKIEQIAKWIVGSKHLVVFTGAGISTASGIPDFRGPDGVWTRRDKGLPPPKMKKAWSQIEPNAGHISLVELQNMDYLKFLITQNTDSLHRRSGIKPELLAELHGNGTLMVCRTCNKKMTYEEAKWDKNVWGAGYLTAQQKEGEPTCPSCISGRLVSSVVNFGDSLPEKDFSESHEHSDKADVYLIVGSSLVVTPAADLPVMAQNNGAKMILLNRGETPLDNIMDIKIEENIAEVLPKIIAKMKEYITEKKTE